MKSLYWMLPAALLMTAPAAAQETRAEGERDAAVEEAEFEERMREAEQRLEEAARRVAELSTERLGSMRDAYRYAFAYSDRPRLGVTIGDDGDKGPVEGVRVVAVSPNGAAADAGIRAGDIITSVNGESLSASSAKEANVRLLDFMNGVEEGDKVDVEYLRDGNVGKVAVEPRVVDGQAFAWGEGMKGGPLPRMPEIHLAPKLAEKFHFRFGGWRGAWADMELVELTEGLGRYFGTDSGLLVISAPTSNAFTLQEGDVIERIDGREPSSVNHCMRILGSYEPGEKIVLQIMRDKKRQTIEVEVPDDRASHVIPRSLRPAHPARVPLPVLPPLPAERT